MKLAKQQKSHSPKEIWCENDKVQARILAKGEAFAHGLSLQADSGFILAYAPNPKSLSDFGAGSKTDPQSKRKKRTPVGVLSFCAKATKKIFFCVLQ